jgi:hypothetical protein
MERWHLQIEGWAIEEWRWIRDEHVNRVAAERRRLSLWWTTTDRDEPLQFHHVTIDRSHLM